MPGRQAVNPYLWEVVPMNRAGRHLDKIRKGGRAIFNPVLAESYFWLGVILAIVYICGR
ncbi:MAG: hypothetical protein ACOWWM_09575 [Desulfobacterales bacterium]